MAVLTPEEADDHDRYDGVLALIGLFLSIFWPAPGIALVLLAGIEAICVAIDRHLPMDSPHRKKGSE